MDLFEVAVESEALGKAVKQREIVIKTALGADAALTLVAAGGAHATRARARALLSSIVSARASAAASPSSSGTVTPAHEYAETAADAHVVAAPLSVVASPAASPAVSALGSGAATVAVSHAPSPPPVPAHAPMTVPRTMVLRPRVSLAAAAGKRKFALADKLDEDASLDSSKRVKEVKSWMQCDDCDAWHPVPLTHAHTVPALAAGKWTCPDATWALLECAPGEGGKDEDVGTVEELFSSFQGATGELVTLYTATQRQRDEVLKLTGLVVSPLDFNASYALAQSATKSREWREQKTRRNLSGRELVAQLRRDGYDDMAELIKEQDAACLFCYGDHEFCVVHFDKSKESDRWMARLPEARDKTHYLMIQGSDGVVYNVVMTGPVAYRGMRGTLLAERRHAVPKPKAGGGDVTTLLITLAVDAGDFDAQFKALLTGVEKTEELWVDFECVQYKRSSADISRSDRSKGGKVGGKIGGKNAQIEIRVALLLETWDGSEEDLEDAVKEMREQAAAYATSRGRANLGSGRGARAERCGEAAAAVDREKARIRMAANYAAKVAAKAATNAARSGKQ